MKLCWIVCAASAAVAPAPASAEWVHFGSATNVEYEYDPSSIYRSGPVAEVRMRQDHRADPAAVPATDVLLVVFHCDARTRRLVRLTQYGPTGQMITNLDLAPHALERAITPKSADEALLTLVCAAE